MVNDGVFCKASMNYIGGDDTLPQEVTILDGRQQKLPGWETCGFELHHHDSKVSDWADSAQVGRVHYPEISSLAQLLTGCDHAFVTSHISRNPEAAGLHADLAPIAFVHSDFAESYGEQTIKAWCAPEVQPLLQKAGLTTADIEGARRLVILQFWRNVGPQKMDMPIAFCDARTVERQEIRTRTVSDYAGGGGEFETMGVEGTHSKNHKWYAFPEMAADEVVAFRTFDSDMVTANQPFWTPHSAFQDPDIVPGAPSRYSIELRSHCFFL